MRLPSPLPDGNGDLLLAQRPDLDRAEPHRLPVILQDDPPHRRNAERRVLELAGCHPLLPVVGADLEVRDLHAVQPMLDLLALGDNAALVPLADRVARILRWRVQPVGCAVAAIRVLLGGLPVVVCDLILDRDSRGRLRRRRHAIEDPAITQLRNLPLHHELEIAIHAVRGKPARLPLGLEGAVLDDPFSARRRTRHHAPAIQRLAIEDLLELTCFLSNGAPEAQKQRRDAPNRAREQAVAPSNHALSLADSRRPAYNADIRRASILLALVGCLLALDAFPAPPDLASRVEAALRTDHRLRIYDWVEYRLDGSTVTLTGTVSLVSLAPDLERRVRQVDGVEQVINRIEPPAPSREDMAMRVNVYWRLYGNPELRRYAKGPEHVPSRIQRDADAPQPILLRPIHAVVQDGHITLHGEVDQQRDVETAEQAAWAVMGVRSVDNRLAVVTDNTEERQAQRPGPDPWWTDVSSAQTPSLLVDNPSGGVTVRVASTDSVRIRKTSEDRAVVDGDVVVDRLHRKMRVRARPADGARIDLDIDLPYGYLLEVESVDGWVDLRGLFRRANVKIATGQIDLHAPWEATRLRVESARRPPVVELPDGFESPAPPLTGRAPEPDMIWTLEDGRAPRESVYGNIRVEAQWPDALRVHASPMPADSPVRMHGEAAETIRRMFRLDEQLDLKTRGPQPEMEADIDLETGFAHFSDDVRLVDLDIAVLDAEGRPIAGLTAADFEIVEEGVPQTIKTVEGENTGFNLVLLLDCSTSTLDDRFTLIQAARQFVSVARPQDRVAVYVLADSYLQVLSPLADDEEELTRRIDDIPPLAGSTPLYDAIVLSYAQELSKRRFERNALVVLSDGMDNQLLPRLGHSRPSIVAFEDLERSAAEMNALIYPIFLDAAEAPYTSRNRQWHRWRTRARTNMQSLAAAAGGKLFKATSLRSLEPVYEEVASELQSIYRVGYYPKNQDFNGAWRKVEVRLKRPGARIRTRPGYYAW